MQATHSKSAYVYRQVKRALQSGRYAPGQRIDPARLADEFHTSPTPVRFALYRLVGEGLVADHARNGLHVPLLTEVALRDLYDWMERMLLMACDIGIAPPEAAAAQLQLGTSDDDLVDITWQLFDAIAEATGQSALRHSVMQANDRLTPVRRANLGLVKHNHEELSALLGHWQHRDIPALRAALRHYHERRKQAVPHIVAALNERSEGLH